MPFLTAHVSLIVAAALGGVLLVIFLLGALTRRDIRVVEETEDEGESEDELTGHVRLIVIDHIIANAKMGVRDVGVVDASFLKLYRHLTATTPMSPGDVSAALLAAGLLRMVTEELDRCGYRYTSMLVTNAHWAAEEMCLQPPTPEEIAS